MTMENSGHEETKPLADNVQPPNAENVPNPSRRRFNRAGIGASAVVMTLASRSVLANTCKSASGFYSANKSAHGTPPVCNGKLPEGWIMTAADSWPIGKGSTFTGIFGSVSNNLKVGQPSRTDIRDNGEGKPGLKLADSTLQQALFGSDTLPLIKFVIAALLNSVNLNVHPTRESVIKIFQEWNTSMKYQVSAGIFWDEQQIIDYLKATQTPSFSSS